VFFFYCIQNMSEMDFNVCVKQNGDLSLVPCGQSYQSESALLFAIPEMKWRPERK